MDGLTVTVGTKYYDNSYRDNLDATSYATKTVKDALVDGFWILETETQSGDNNQITVYVDLATSNIDDAIGVLAETPEVDSFQQFEYSC